MQKYRSLELVRQHPLVRRFGLITLGLILFVVLLLFLPWQQTVKGSATLIAYDPVKRPYQIKAPIDGFVERYAVQEGSEVQAGDLLVVLRDLDPKLDRHLQEQLATLSRQMELASKDLRSVESSLQELQELIRRSEEIVTERIAQFRKRFDALQERGIALEDRVAIARKNKERYERLERMGAVSTQEAERYRNQYKLAQADLMENLAKRSNLQKEIRILQKELERQRNQNRIERERLLVKKRSIDRQIQKLQAKRSEILIQLGRYHKKIYAKSDGVVAQIYRNDKNRYIKRGEPLLLFVPKIDKRVLRTEVSDFNMPLIKPGLEARIVFYGWPAMHISGWPKISYGTYGGRVLFVEPFAREDGRLFVMIEESEPWPDPALLKPGTKATVWIRLGVVPIWYELWRLMMAQPPNMVEESE